MQTFIDKVVQFEIDYDNSESIFIVPSRRAGARLRNTLASLSKKTDFAPEIYSIEEFIAVVSGLRQASNPAQLFALYQSYLNCTPKTEHESFRTFCGWAQTLIGDFNEVDRYLISQDLIFNHLRDIKELSSHWSGHSTSTIIQNYLNFWNNLEKIYNEFCGILSNEGLAHQGLIYRKSVENLESYLQANGDVRHVFVGFNALNNAEQQLIQGLLAGNKSIIYWDVEKYFQDSSIHEVSIFTRRYAKEWSYFRSNDFHWISDNYSQPKIIQTYACSSDIIQAKTIGNLVKDLTDEELEQTAIVLGDESLLLPLLNALPNTLKKLNITMGIPLGQTPIASFFDALLVMKRTRSPKGYHYKDVLQIVSHPLIQEVLANNANVIHQKITQQNRTFISTEELISMVSGDRPQRFILGCFRPWNNPKMAIESCLSLIKLLREEVADSQNYLQLEYLFGFYKVFNQLASLQQQNRYIEDIATLTFFYQEILSNETVDLRGDPEKGLQIMGVLESRVLDYERVIISSVNEGVLPSGKSQNSFIPYDLKREFGLPTYFEKDAIYAYHFYRLLHRAKHVSLVYITESEGLGSVEKSRFIRQLEEERIHKIEQIQAIPYIKQETIQKFTIEKTDEVLNKIMELCVKGLSPSALTTYLRDPIVFYERYILGVEESDTVEETVAANTMGTVVHNALEDLYKPFIGQEVRQDHLLAMLSEIEPTVRSQVNKNYGLEFISQGKNLIIYEVILRYIENYIRLEIQKIEQGDTVTIVSLEADLREISLKETVNLRGKVDLVENRNGTLHIIDYKTGKVEQKDLNLSNWEDLLKPEGKHEKAFQVLMYAYMMNKKKSLSFPIKAGIISFKNLQSGFLPFSYNRDTSVTQETLDEFEIVLKQLIDEILNPNIPFQEREV